MPNTLADLRKNIDDGTELWTGTDDSTPEGTFIATAKVLGIVTTYLLEGQTGDEGAAILGRIEHQGTMAAPRRAAYASNGIKGGSYVGSADDEDLFATMVRHHASHA